MASVRVAFTSRRVWTVEGKCLDEPMSQSFDREEDAEWFRDVAQQYWNARCPKCGVKNILGLDLSEFPRLGWTVLVVCGFHTCSFAKKLVSFGEPDEW